MQKNSEQKSYDVQTADWVQLAKTMPSLDNDSRLRYSDEIQKIEKGIRSVYPGDGGETLIEACRDSVGLVCILAGRDASEIHAYLHLLMLNFITSDSL